MSSFGNTEQNETYESNVKLVKQMKKLYESSAPKHLKMEVFKSYCKINYEGNKFNNILETKVYGHLHNNNYAKAKKAIIKFKEDRTNDMESILFDGKECKFGIVIEDVKPSLTGNTEAVRLFGIYLRYKFDEFDILLKFIE